MNPADTTLRHLLVVDDDDRLRALLKQYLARAGFRVTVADNADGARRMLEMFRKKERPAAPREGKQ